MKETVENLAQENHQLRSENNHLKGNRKATIIKIVLWFVVLFVFALCLIIWGTDQQNLGNIQNSTHGETLVVNIALDGAKLEESGLEEKTIASYGNINLNFHCNSFMEDDEVVDKKTNEQEEELQFGSSYLKRLSAMREEIIHLNFHCNSFMEDDEVVDKKTNEQEEELQFGSSYLKRLSAMREEIIQRVKKPSKNQTEIDDRIDEVLEEVHKEEVLLQNMKNLAGNVEDLVLEESDISQTLKKMYEYLKVALEMCTKFREMEQIIKVNREIYLTLADHVMLFVSCGQLTSDHLIKQSNIDVIEILKKCDFHIIVQRFSNFVEELSKVQDEISSTVPESLSISNYSTVDETAIVGITTAHFGILQRLEEKSLQIMSNSQGTMEILEKVGSSMRKLHNCLQPTLLEDLRMMGAHNVIEALKEILEAYAAVSQIKETI